MIGKTYLGDGAYVEYDEGSVKVTTHDGYRDTNVVYLDRDSVEALQRWLGMLEGELGEAQHAAREAARERGI